MAKARSKKSKRDTRQTEVVPEVDDEEWLSNERDFIMARLAAARTSFQAAVDAIDEALALCVNPDEDDRDGGERDDLIDTAVECAGAGTIAIQLAEVAWREADSEVAKMGEPDIGEIGDGEDD